jgi:prepilin-type N-terminal cleavage/methylation domain-containing protein
MEKLLKHRIVKAKQKQHGWTLVELLVVVVIIGILAMVLLARVPYWLDKSKEAKTRDVLRDLRVQIKRYYAENRGYYPIALDRERRSAPDDPNIILPAFIPNYMAKMPKARIRSGTGHGDSSDVLVVDTGNDLFTSEDIKDLGGWIYSSTTGEIRVNCTHLDTAGKIHYSNYGYEEVE